MLTLFLWFEWAKKYPDLGFVEVAANHYYKGNVIFYPKNSHLCWAPKPNERLSKSEHSQFSFS
ncbi:MAG: hypothetical protein AMJ73_00285 [candidate division Zixibacteria bacterium SM1_73]|nr:MAG: hypothetical protein AMJ73_00285 [candidate division Zixibacteria bacterium SM1_73]